jgi:hypothetical protein
MRGNGGVRTSARLFGSGTGPPYSDGPAGFEALLSQTDLAPVAVTGEPAGEAARCVVSRFAELEACFRDVSSAQPVRVRLGRVQALTSATIALVGALRHEHAQAYATFISSCLDIE